MASQLRQKNMLLSSRAPHDQQSGPCRCGVETDSDAVVAADVVECGGFAFGFALLVVLRRHLGRAADERRKRRGKLIISLKKKTTD